MTGKVPFEGVKSDLIAMAKIMNGETPDPTQYPELPASDPLWVLFQQCWKPNPDERPSMREVRDRVSDLAHAAME